MTLLIDAAPIVALADPAEPQRAAILDALTSETGSLVIPAPTTTEIDYLLGQRFGSAARRESKGLDDLLDAVEVVDRELLPERSGELELAVVAGVAVAAQEEVVGFERHST